MTGKRGKFRWTSIYITLMGHKKSLSFSVRNGVLKYHVTSCYIGFIAPVMLPHVSNVSTDKKASFQSRILILQFHSCFALKLAPFSSLCRSYIIFSCSLCAAIIANSVYFESFLSKVVLCATSRFIASAPTCGVIVSRTSLY